MSPLLLTDATHTATSLPVAGIDLGYHDVGSGPPLLLLMGLGAPGSAWELHARAWTSSFRCLAVDNRGTGRSGSPPGPWSTEQMADDCAELLGALDLDAVRVVGVSMGGAVAQELAIRHPHLVSRLVLVSAWARCDAYLADTFASIAAVRAGAPAATYLRALHLWIWGRAYYEQHRQELAQEQLTGMLPVSAESVVAQASACTAHDALAALAGIAVPTLVTVGADDIFTPPAFSRQLADSIPDARLVVVPAAGHAHHWESLDEFNLLVGEWLS